MMACGRNCSDGWDVRCCCEPNCLEKNTTNQFNKCPKKLDTLFFHLLNDYRTLEIIEERKADMTMDFFCPSIIRKIVKVLHKGIKSTNDECIDLKIMLYDEPESDDYGIGDEI